MPIIKLIEGALRQDAAEIDRLAVDTHGVTHFSMALAKLLGLDVCPRLERLLVEHNATEAKPFRWTANPDRIIDAVRRGHQMLGLSPLARHFHVKPVTIRSER